MKDSQRVREGDFTGGKYIKESNERFSTCELAISCMV